MTRRTVIRRGLIAALAGFCALGSPPAGASVVEGGGSFDDAPLLGEGTYDDTILPQETLFYRVALGEGQRLLVDAGVDLSPGSKGERGDADALGGFGLMFYTPLRERLGTDYVGPPLRGGPDLQSDGDTRRLPRVISAARADRGKIAGTADWTGPGIYTFTAAISAIYGDPGAVVEFPLRLRIAIEGPSPPPGDVGPGPLGEPGGAASAASPRQTAAGRSHSSRASGGSGVSDLLLVAAGLAALLAGAVLGGIAGRGAGAV